jgi:hypothetical protein
MIFSLRKNVACVAGDGEDEEPACGRDDHEEEEK